MYLSIHQQSLAVLSRLKMLNLLTGTIPSSFSNLPSLKHLQLAYNSFSSSHILSQLRNLRNLKTLILTGCNLLLCELTGMIPTELCKLSLRSLNLYENKLEGVLPPILVHSPNLYELKLFSNKLIGTLPRDLGSNSPLKHIDVSFN